jgi:hypothetical protein
MLMKRATICRGRGHQDAEKEGNKMLRNPTRCRGGGQHAEGNPGVAREETFVDKCKGKIVNKLLNNKKHTVYELASKKDKSPLQDSDCGKLDFGVDLMIKKSL